MWGNDDSIAFIVVVVEGRGERPIHVFHGVRIEDSRRSPPRFAPVSENLVCSVAGPPGGRSQRADDSPTVLVLPKDARRPDGGQCFFLRDNPPHGIPVQAGCGLPGKDAESGIGSRLLEFGSALDEACDAGAQALGNIVVLGPGTGPNGSTFEFPDQDSSSCSASNSKTDCPVASRLPLDIRVQTDQTRIPDKVIVLRQVTHDFRREECRAHPPQAVRIVDADPEDHATSYGLPRLKSGAPRTFK